MSKAHKHRAPHPATKQEATARTNLVSAQDGADSIATRHYRWGWWSLLGFLTLGIVLESLHGFKLGWYLDVPNEIRRLMLTLGHAHGTLLSLVNIAFAATLGRFPLPDAARVMASKCILAGSLLLPGGFILGGIWIYDGDPGLGIVLVPGGAVFLLCGVFITAKNLGK